MLQVVKPQRQRLVDSKPTFPKITLGNPLNESYPNQNIAAINMNKLTLTNKKSILSISLALEMVVAQMKATKTPAAVINPFR
jgi:hypothetical protein